MAEPTDFGIELAGGDSATTRLHRALRAAVDAYPSEFTTADVPTDPSVFRSSFADVLPRFEAARADSSRRGEIARTIVDSAASAMVMRPDDVALADAVAAPSAPLDLESWAPGGGSLPGTMSTLASPFMA